MDIINRFSYIVLMLVSVVMLASCISEPIYTDEEPDSSTFCVNVSVAIPALSTTSSRGLSAHPDYQNLKVYVVEFERSGSDPLDNFLSEVYQTTIKSVGTDYLEFNLRLTKSNKPRILHFIVVPKDIDLAFNEGTEGSVIPYLQVGDNCEAYWNRLEFSNGYGDFDANGNWTIAPEMQYRLSRIPLIRNFAQISVNVSPACADNFELLGFAIINKPTHGSIAPWNQDSMLFPEMLNADAQKNYDDLDYHGFLADYSVQRNLSEEDLTQEPKFIYEIPFNPSRHVQLIVKAIVGNLTRYYKVELGRIHSETGIFEYLNIIRNFHYRVAINDAIGDSGSESLAEALTGPVVNTISFNVDTEKMLNISDGSGMMWVSFTTAVVTSQDNRKLRLAYRFMRNLNTSAGIVDNDKVSVYGLNPGSVIESVSTDIESPEDSADWKFIDIRTHLPSLVEKRQQIVLVDRESKLARTVTIILRSPWEVRNTAAFAGEFMMPGSYPEAASQFMGKAGYEAQSPLTVVFTLPDNLPRAIFPLTFVIECNPQTVENNPINDLVVTASNSLWGASFGRRIQYLKKVTWVDYNTDFTVTSPNGVRENAFNDTERKIHRVRCRLRTLSAVESQAETATIRIYNPYFSTEMIPGSSDRVNNGVIECSYTRTPNVSIDNAPQ